MWRAFGESRESKRDITMSGSVVVRGSAPSENRLGELDQLWNLYVAPSATSVRSSREECAPYLTCLHDCLGGLDQRTWNFASAFR